MKTKSEIQAEAQQLTILGRQYQNEQSQVVVNDTVVAMPRVLMTLPELQVAVRPVAVAEGEATLATRNVRHIEAALEGGDVVYRLVERETDFSSPSGEAHSTVKSSRSAYDVLRTSYELVEEERLAADLERFTEHTDDRGESPDGEAVAEVEAILETNLLPHAHRLRAKAEIVEFLAGRMEPSAFIANAVERQCEREGHVVRRTQRHEIKLTIDES